MRARVLTKKTKSEHSSEGTTTTRTYTLIEADLHEPVETGALVSRGDRAFHVDLGNSDDDPNLRGEFGDLTAVEEEPFVAQTNDGPTIRDVLAGRAKKKLRELTSFDLLHGGHSEAIYAELFSSFVTKLSESMPEVGGFSVASMFPSGAEIAENVDKSDAATVTYQHQEVVRDGDELDRQLDAVVAVADAFERGQSRTREE